MWGATNNDGSLIYAFIDSVVASKPGYFVRFIGGLCFLSGMLLMAYNMMRTLSQDPSDRPVKTSQPVVEGAKA